MGVLGLHHAGLYVANLERSIAFYRDVFGLELAEQLTFGAEKIAFVRIGASRLELIEATGSQRPTGVVDHVALEVDDLDTALQRLRAHGVTLLDLTPIPVPPLQARILFCVGPDAERIELFEYHHAVR
jgi:catechol 2,3-dioxygenase-like lactoylglutathione lyase family enzyme